MRKVDGAVAVLLVAALAGAAAEPASRRPDVERALKQRYRLTLVGTGMFGLTGDRASIREAGGILNLRRAGLQGSLDPDQPASFHIRQGQAQAARGGQDVALPVGEKFYLHSLYVGSDVIVLGLLPEEGLRPLLQELAPAPEPPPPAVPSELKPGSYRLVVTVTDPATKLSASQTLAFKVAQVGGNLGRTTIVNGHLAEDARQGWLDYRRALCQAGQNRPEEALRLLERALERNPNLGPARDKLATLMFQRGDHARVATLAAGATIAPDTGLDAILAYLAALEEAGQRIKAIELGEQAVAVLAPAGSLYEEMAALYEKSGQMARAQEMRNQARRHASNPPKLLPQ